MIRNYFPVVFLAGRFAAFLAGAFGFVTEATGFPIFRCVMIASVFARMVLSISFSFPMRVILILKISKNVRPNVKL